MDNLTALYESIIMEQSIPALNDIFDNRKGHGQVPNGIDINYFGFIKPLKYSEFRSLVPSGVSDGKTKEFIKNAILSGETIGNPFLLAKWNDKWNVWLVMDHEGRSRMDAIKELYGDVEVPVHIFPTGGLRARHITDEMKSAPFVPQNTKY